MPPTTLKRAASTDKDISPPPTSRRKLPPSATAATVANFFKPASEKIKVPEKVAFKVVHDTVLTTSIDKQETKLIDRTTPVKIAAFDFDDTLVTTASGNRFSKDAQDWKWWNAAVPERLKALHDDGYHLVVISNQGAIKLHPDPKLLKGDMKSLNNFKGKVTSVLTRLDLPIHLFAATGHDIYRKPRPGMWELVLQTLDATHASVDFNHSIFVGDAAGRQADKVKGTRKDHSSSDRDLATNIGIKFHTPEEFFLKQDPVPYTRVFEPTEYINGGGTAPTAFVKQNELDLVLFCGSPGAGKSTYYWTYLQPLGYERANQDILKTRDRCKQVAREHIEAGRSVAIDNTNADVEVRASWVALARQLRVPIRLVHFTAPPKLCEHNDTIRALSKVMNPENRTKLPKMAFSGFVTRYKEPSVSEGFADITKVDFEFTGSEDQKLLWQRYWIS